MKLDQRRIDAIVVAIKLGATRADAAVAGGISRASFYNYVQAGDADRKAGVESIHTRLLDALEMAEAELAQVVTGHWLKAAYAGDWRAGATFLSRRFPAEWAPKADVPTTRVTVNGQAVIENPAIRAKARELRDALAELDDEE